MLLALSAAAAAAPATLAEAIQHWTGLLTDVDGTGDHVRIGLPRGSPVPGFTAIARLTDRSGEPGWQLTAVMLPVPLALRDGSITVRRQRASGWLGERSAQADATFDGIALTGRDGSKAGLDQLHAATNGQAGQATLAVEASGVHLADPPPGFAQLLPRHASLHAHATQADIAALAAIIAGQPAPRAQLVLDKLDFDLGQARVHGTGTVIILSRNDRRGEITLTATGFDAMMQQLPTDGPAVRLYPGLMVVRAMAQRQGDSLTWLVALSGRKVLINGIDIAPLFGL